VSVRATVAMRTGQVQAVSCQVPAGFGGAQPQISSGVTGYTFQTVVAGDLSEETVIEVAESIVE